MFGYVINEIFIYGCEFFMDYYSFIMDDIIVGVFMILWYLIYLKIRLLWCFSKMICCCEIYDI